MNTQARDTMKRYIISRWGIDIEACTIDKGCTIKELRAALKPDYKARVAKPGEAEGIPQKHYSAAANSNMMNL